MSLDRVDLKILEYLQEDGQLTNLQLADMIGLSATPCARRVRKLEDEGYIASYRASLNRIKIGLRMTVFVNIRLNNHQEKSVEQFEQQIIDMDEVINCHIISGSYDYILEIVVEDLTSYENTIRKLQRFKHVQDINSNFSIRSVKRAELLPLSPTLIKK
jgi:Lrp/AsnC family transcriptional regulator, leucine-responsive regulatory protein